MGGYATNPDTNSASEITGSGTANYLSKFTSAQTIGNSGIYDDGSTIIFTRPARFNDTMYIETEGIITWSSATALAIYATVSDFNLVTQAAKAITLFNNNTETMRLFANNNVSIGYGIAVSARLQVVGSTNDDTAYAFKAMSLNLTELLSVRNDGTTSIGGVMKMTTGRVLEKQGASVASANNLVLGSDGNCFEITGATQINLISNLSWQDGSLITLLFTSNPTVKHNQATSTTNITILLAGAVDFGATAGDTLTLRLSTISGTQAWREIGRAVI